MTIAIALKINDGIVLATDSASSIIGEENRDGVRPVHHTYFTADKIFNIIKGEPIGVMTWGNGSINNESISKIVKDFRNEYKINYKSIENVVDDFIEFLKNKLTKDSTLGFLISGYSENKDYPQMFLIDIINGEINKFEINSNEPLSISWFGETKFLTRFLLCYDETLIDILHDNEIDEKDIENIINDCYTQLQLPLGVPAMPIQDAIDLVKFLAEFSVKSSRFYPGPQVIGGPIDIAVITKHEGFKWIQRKHYYDNKFNLNTVKEE